MSGGDRRERPAFGSRDTDRRSFDRPRRDDRPARATGGNRADWNADAKDAAARKAYEAHADVVHEKLQAQAVQAEEVADVSFAGLGLGENIVRALAELGAAAPFPIQAATIAPILAGKDVLARGRTGSGKTIAFGAPLVESVLRSQAGKRRAFGRSPRALILAPTRELALQIDRTIQPIARSVGLSRPHFFALFKEQTNLTPNVYWNTLRMEEAVRQLQWSREPLISVACNLGFTTQGNFSRFFRDHVGVPPTLYREAARAVS